MNRFKWISLFLLILTFSQLGWSKVNIKTTHKLVMPADIMTPLISAETSEKIQPKSLDANESAQSIVSKIADNSLSLWWDTSPVRNTQVGRAAEKVEKNLKTEVSFKDKASRTEHRISFKVLAMQALAKLEYKGWVNAAINYDARAEKTEAEVSEKIFKKQDLVLSHAITKQENKSQVAWRWNW